MDYHNSNDFWSGKDPLKGLNEDERIVTGALQVAFFALCFVVGLLICALLGSCTTTRYVPVVHHKTDTLVQTTVKRDSIYLSDSVYVNDFVRDDTVYRTTVRWRTKYIERTSHDTVYQASHDTIPAPFPVTEYVERPVSVFEWVLRIAGGWALLAVVAYVFFRIKRK
jgi:hypothetical protein